MSNWVSTWGQAPTAINVISPNYKNRTMRLTVANNIKGDKIRIRLSNRDGKKTMHIVEAAVQVMGKEQKPIFFGGKQELFVAPQKEEYSKINCNIVK